jgi:transcriptional regulator with XRE-family HTH domain
MDVSSPRRPQDPSWRSRTAHRTSDPDAMEALQSARLRHGWTISQAAQQTGVSRPHLSLLERGLRRPSESVAEDLIAGYRLTGWEADAVRAIALKFVGRDSPFRTGLTPARF